MHNRLCVAGKCCCLLAANSVCSICYCKQLLLLLPSRCKLVLLLYRLCSDCALFNCLQRGVHNNRHTVYLGLKEAFERKANGKEPTFRDQNQVWCL